MIYPKETSRIAFDALALKRTLHTCTAQEHRRRAIRKLEVPALKRSPLFFIILVMQLTQPATKYCVFLSPLAATTCTWLHQLHNQFKKFMHNGLVNVITDIRRCGKSYFLLAERRRLTLGRTFSLGAVCRWPSCRLTRVRVRRISRISSNGE